MDQDIPYLLLTPGPLTTSRGVRDAMRRDLSTWDVDYNQMVQAVRQNLVHLASSTDGYTSVLMQGSGTFAVESTVGSVIPPDGKLLVISNGAYGRRIVQIADRLHIDYRELRFEETAPIDVSQIDRALAGDSTISHVALVHCETTTGMLNPAVEVGAVVARHQRLYILDAMSSFGGIPMSMEELRAQFVIASANKCIQGVPGFGFVIAHQDTLEQTRGWARSLSLDLYDQWREMEAHQGKWRYTSPTHVLCAFSRAIEELQQEGGIAARFKRYGDSQSRLSAGMHNLGFRGLLPETLQSPIITAFFYPADARFAFDKFYDLMKQRRFVLYPGKVTDLDTFRIGTIGHVFAQDIEELLEAVGQVVAELRLEL
ncbi:MAG: 2-aminoethylphosphonate--pyruvate transaminase [Planctomycetaceae bacterium]